MSIVVHFSPDLGKWLVERLDHGVKASDLARTMIEGRMEPRAAHAILSAFVAARAAKSPVPIDSVVVEESDEYVPDPPRLRQGPSIATSDRAVRVLAIAQRPTLALLGDVFSNEECDKLIELARPRLMPATVVDPVTGHDVVANYRTNLAMFFRLRENELVARLDRRISELTNLPVENGEGFQVLHYLEGARSAPHFDFLLPTNAANHASLGRSGQRVCSVVVYLSDVERGGETVFPRAQWAISPQKGNAVYFEYCNGRGQVDHQSLHGGSPVERGEKWVATKWMRQRPFVSASEAAERTSPPA